MSEIPQDIMEAAQKQCDLCGVTATSDMRVHAKHIAAYAIMAERERCAKVAEGRYTRENVHKNAKGEPYEAGRVSIFVANRIAEAIRDSSSAGLLPLPSPGNREG